jgi:hypothetical protein
MSYSCSKALLGLDLFAYLCGEFIGSEVYFFKLEVILELYVAFRRLILMFFAKFNHLMILN